MLTIPEYNLLMKSIELQQVDKNYWVHLQAFKNFQVKAEKKVGKNKPRPVDNNFRKFVDYEKELDRVLNRKKDRFKNLKEYIRRKEK